MTTVTHLEDEKYTNTTACADNCATVERKGDRVTTDASAVTCWRCLARMRGHGYATDTCPTVPPTATECTGFRGVETNAQNNLFRITCNMCGFSGPWRSEPIRAVMEWNFYVRAVRRGMERLPLVGVPTAPPSDHVNNPAPPAPAPAPAPAAPTVWSISTRLDNLDADVARHFADLRKDLRKDLDNGLLSTNSRVVGHMDGLRARMTALGADLRRENEQQFKELRAGTNEALGVLGDRIRALDNAIAGLQPHNRALVEDGVVRAAQAFPKACTKCGAINKGFASPAAELCNGCSNELAALVRD